MAVALKPTASLYSNSARVSNDAQEGQSGSSQNFLNESPRRRSIRIAAKSPTKNETEEESISDSDSSSMGSPSRRHSLRIQQRLGFDDFSILPMNEISVQRGSQAKATISVNQRPRETLFFEPTNLTTPSTTLLESTGITPSLNQISLSKATPALQMDNLVSATDMAEIAKATPLGGFYQRQHPGQPRMTSRNPLENVSHAQLSQTLAKSYSLSTQNQNISPNRQQPKTPPKQIIQDGFLSAEGTAEGTVKIVKTLRNRSIVASPFPLSAARRRSSMAHTKPPANYGNSILNAIQSQFQSLYRLVWRHQRNLLVYSIIFVFLSASVYHVYDLISNFGVNRQLEVDLESLESSESLKYLESRVPHQKPSQIPSQIPIETSSQNPIEIPSKTLIEEERVKMMFQDAQIELREYLEKRLRDESLFTRDPLGNHHLKPEVYSLLLAAIPSGGDSSAMKEYVDRQLQHVLRQITQKLDSRASTSSSSTESFKETVQSLVARIERIEKRLNTKVDAKKTETNPIKPKETSLVDLTLGARIIPELSTRRLQPSSWFSPSRSHDASIILKSDLARDAHFSFAGNRGKVALSFAAAVKPTHITIEHPLFFSDLDASCAPRDFELWALANPRNERDNPRLLGRGTFDVSSGKASQTFVLEKASNVPVRHVQLRIRNNHGNNQRTCLYRLRIQKAL